MDDINTPEKPLESVKMAVDFIKQLIAVSAQLLTFVSGGIYFLRTQKIDTPLPWIISALFLIFSLMAGFLSFGAFVRQLDMGTMSTTKGSARILALVQIVSFFITLFCIAYGGAISVPKLR